MRETGTVVQVKKNMAIVRFKHSPACSGCAMGCAAKGKERIIEAYDRVGVKPGERVEVEFEERKALLGSALTYIVPLFFFIAGYAAGSLLTSFFKIKSEGPAILSAFLFLSLSYLFIRWLMKKSIIKEETFIPVIIRKYSENES
jgi:positive regulator of sigma E activity